MGVDIPERWLADVGFGKRSLYQLRLDDRLPQVDPDGTFIVNDTGQGDVDIIKANEAQYRIELRARTLHDVEPLCCATRRHRNRTSPKSLTCSLLRCRRQPVGSPRSDCLLKRTANGTRRETELGDDADTLAAYRTFCNIVLDRVPHLAVGD